MMTRTTNGHHVTINTTGVGQGWAKEGTTGAVGARDKPLSIFFFFFFLLIFYLLNVYSHLELLWWQQMATTTTHHLHLHTECRLHLKFWYVNFFCPLLNNYLLLDCVYGTVTRTTMANSYHLWDNEWGLGMHHLCLESRVYFFFLYFLDMFLFSFFIIVSTYLDVSTTTTTILSNRTSRCNMSQAQVSFFFMFLFFLN